MSKSEDSGNASPETAKKPYAAPKLTEYGNVSKLTMTKGTTQVELVPKKLRACL